MCNFILSATATPYRYANQIESSCIEILCPLFDIGLLSVAGAIPNYVGHPFNHPDRLIPMKRPVCKTPSLVPCRCMFDQRGKSCGPAKESDPVASADVSAALSATAHHIYMLIH